MGPSSDASQTAQEVSKPDEDINNEIINDLILMSLLGSSYLLMLVSHPHLFLFNLLNCLSRMEMDIIQGLTDAWTTNIPIPSEKVPLSTTLS